MPLWAWFWILPSLEPHSGVEQRHRMLLLPAPTPTHRPVASGDWCHRRSDRPQWVVIAKPGFLLPGPLGVGASAMEPPTADDPPAPGGQQQAEWRRLAPPQGATMRVRQKHPQQAQWPALQPVLDARVQDEQQEGNKQSATGYQPQAYRCPLALFAGYAGDFALAAADLSHHQPDSKADLNPYQWDLKLRWRAQKPKLMVH